MQIGATVCLKGHIVSRSMPDYKPFCPECGQATFSKCQECGTPIPPLPVVAGAKSKPSGFCSQCGAPYPWTKLLLDNAVELLALDDEIDADSKELIKNALPDLLTESPTTPLAAAKYNKGIARAGEFLKNSLYDLLKDAVCDMAKRRLFGG